MGSTDPQQALRIAGAEKRQEVRGKRGAEPGLLSSTPAFRFYREPGPAREFLTMHFHPRNSPPRPTGEGGFVLSGSAPAASDDECTAATLTRGCSDRSVPVQAKTQSTCGRAFDTKHSACPRTNRQRSGTWSRESTIQFTRRLAGRNEGRKPPSRTGPAITTT